MFNCFDLYCPETKAEDVSLYFSCLTHTKPNQTHACCYILFFFFFSKKNFHWRKRQLLSTNYSTEVLLFFYFTMFHPVFTVGSERLQFLWLPLAGDWAEGKDGWRWRYECVILVCLVSHQRLCFFYFCETNPLLRIVRFTSVTLRNKVWKHFLVPFDVADLG